MNETASSSLQSAQKANLGPMISVANVDLMSLIWADDQQELLPINGDRPTPRREVLSCFIGQLMRCGSFDLAGQGAPSRAGWRMRLL